LEARDEAGDLGLVKLELGKRGGVFDELGGHFGVLRGGRGGGGGPETGGWRGGDGVVGEEKEESAGAWKHDGEQDRGDAGRLHAAVDCVELGVSYVLCIELGKGMMWDDAKGKIFLGSRSWVACFGVGGWGNDQKTPHCEGIK